MPRRRVVLIAASLVPIALLACQSTPKASVDSPPISDQRPGTPFELTSNKPFLQVRVNGSDPLWFILDTGACGGSAIDRERALALGLEIRGERRAHTGAGEGALITIGHAAAVTLSVPGAELVDQPAAILPLNHVAAYEGRTVDGLLGYDFFSRYVVEIDYANSTIHLHDPVTFEYAGSGRSIPITFLNGLVVVRASITVPERAPLEADFVVDTGVRTTLVLNRPFVEENKLLESMPRVFAATIGGGAGGECKGLVGRISSVQLGPFLINQPVAVFSQDRTGVLAGRAFAGIIGGQILKRCKVFFDYSHKRLILEPNARVPAPYEYDMSGTFLIAEGADFKKFRVQSVMEDSPAAEAGIQKGDVITFIDGRPAAEFTLEQLRRQFKQKGREYRLELRRGEQRLDVRLKPRRLI